MGRRRSAFLLSLLAVLLAGAGYSFGPTAGPRADNRADGEAVSGCRGTDGDTIRCGEERIRLLGIDAPELPGHCRQGRVCAPGDPIASTESLRAALTGNLRIQRVGRDRYGRTIALVSGAKGDVSCWQLQHRQAIYRADWDNGARLRAGCRWGVGRAR
jgi:micrococcal nuclease